MIARSAADLRLRPRARPDRRQLVGGGHAQDVFDYTGEDVAEICKGGRGGSRCSTNN